MDKKVSDSQMIEQLEKLLPRMEGAERESILFKIKVLKLKISSRNGGGFKELESTNVSKQKLENKIEREKNLLSGYKKLISADPDLSKSLNPKCEYATTKIYFLKKELRVSDAVDDEKEFGDKTSGKVNILIVDYECDPIYKTESIDFVVDLNLRVSTKPKKEKKVPLKLENNREIEIVIKGQEGKIIGLLFFPCENLVDLDNNTVYLFNFQDSAIMRIKIEFVRERKIKRQNAEIVAKFEQGHELVSYSGIYTLYCCVCENLASFFYGLYRCRRCKFTCHKKCANYILFRCKMDKSKVSQQIIKRYNIPHNLKEETSNGMKWCLHCGDRVAAGKTFYKCLACKHHFHNECEPCVFPSCNIQLELRFAVSEVKPPSADYTALGPRISIKDFSLIKVLGRGSSGKVMLAKHKEDKEIVAMKILKKEQAVNMNSLAYLETERHILETISRYKHPFLMQMKYCFQDKANVYFGTEYLAGGDLFHHVSQGKFSYRQNRIWVAEIVLGIEFLHSRNIIYRDLKLENILLTADGHVKIADFGLCKEKEEFAFTTFTCCGTLDTMAPEVIQQKGYTKDVDWWSLGVVMFEMYEFEAPFNGATRKELVHAILNTQPKFGSKLSEAAKDLVLKFLAKEPEKRIGHGSLDGKEVRSHKYFDSIDWDSLEQKKMDSEFKPGDSMSNFDEEFTDSPIIITPSSSVPSYEKFFANFK